MDRDRLIAINSLLLLPRCAGYWHKDDEGGPPRDTHCSRAATHRIADPRMLTRGHILLRCEGHADIDQLGREFLEKLPQRLIVLELEKVIAQ